MPNIYSNRIMAQERRRREQRVLRQKEKKRKGSKDQNGLYFRLQTRLRGQFERVRPRSLKPRQEISTGVDYTFAGKKIDFKFSFGAMGNETISIRMRGKDLINNSDWTLICNSMGKIAIFKTQKIRDYAQMNATRLKNNLVLNKGTYTIHKVSLADLLGELQYTGDIHSSTSVLKALKKMNRQENPSINTSKNFNPGPNRAKRERMGKALSGQWGIPTHAKRMVLKHNPGTLRRGRQ